MNLEFFNGIEVFHKIYGPGHITETDVRYNDTIIITVRFDEYESSFILPELRFILPDCIGEFMFSRNDFLNAAVDILNDTSTRCNFRWKLQKIKNKVAVPEFRDFFDVVRYAKSNSMCTHPGCTTCGCMPYKDMCKNDIGFDNMCKLISAVTESQIKHTLDYWYEPLIIVYGFVFRNLPEDNPLMQEYFKLRQLQVEKIAKRRAIAKQHEEEQKAFSEKKKAERKEKMAERARRLQEADKKRNEELEKFYQLDLNGMLLMACNDLKHTPEYYQFDYGDITVDELTSLPEETLDKVMNSYNRYKESGWRDLKRKIRKIRSEAE